ncbi:polyprotein [Torradovirus erigeronis]|uniref:RNA1 polyprotein n=1 Tax=Fleabane torradovirus TaxID=2963535 RepID=A0AAE9SG37_9SECO|nr:polyprotein [Fleabane torradovirus]
MACSKFADVISAPFNVAKNSYDTFCTIGKVATSLAPKLEKMVDHAGGVAESVEMNILPSLLEATNDVQETLSVVRESSPKVSTIVNNVEKVTSTLERVLSGLENIIKPLFRLNDFLWKTWSTISKLFLEFIFRAKTCAVDIASFITGQHDLSSVVPIVGVVAVSTLLSMRFIIGSDMLSSCLATVATALEYVRTFVTSLLPDGKIKKWIENILGVSKPLLEAQGGTTFGTQVSPFTYGDIISSVFAFGFSSMLYFMVGSDRPGRSNGNPVSNILCASGDHASKMNQLFNFFRNVKTSLGDTLVWLGEWLCEITGFASPLTATINSVLNTDLFQWFSDVSAALDPKKKLENFSNPDYIGDLSKLRDRVGYFEAEFTKFPISAFVSQRFHLLVARLDKMLADAQAHKGVGNYRDEPFCVQFVGQPGCGKTMSIGLLIQDLLDVMEEPKTNRLYSMSSKDSYWSNYNHQTAVLIDDFGQILDGSQQNPEVKDFIFLKSSAPMSLNMASIEEKGTQFTSKYIFLTSNEKTPARTCGVTSLGAVQRRRNLLFEVEKMGPIDESCESPVQNLRYTLLSSVAPFHPFDEFTRMTYEEMLNLCESKCRSHFRHSTWLRKFTKGLLQAQAPTPEIEEVEEPKGDEGVYVTRELILSSFKNSYTGSLDPTKVFDDFPTVQEHFSQCDADIQSQIFEWRKHVLVSGIRDGDIGDMTSMMEEYIGRHLMAWVNDFSFDNIAFREAYEKQTGKFSDFVNSDDDDAMATFRRATKRTQYLFALIVRHHGALKSEVSNFKNEIPMWKQVFEYVKNAWDSLPNCIKMTIKIYVSFRAASFVFSTISHFVPMFNTPALDMALSTSATACALNSHVSNESGDNKTKRGVGKRHRERMLTAQSDLSFEPLDWSAWTKGDPFFNDALIKNLVLLNFPGGSVFRGLYVQPGWILSVGHAFTLMNTGSVIEIVHLHSTIAVALDKSPSTFKVLKGQDAVLFYVGDVDGIKKNIVNHFASRKRIICSKGSKGAIIRPIFSTVVPGTLLSQEVVGTVMECDQTGPITYEATTFSVQSASTFQYRFVGVNGDCGSLLVLPDLMNKQPVLCGIHCAGTDSFSVSRGFIQSHACAVYREDLLALLPEPVLKAQGPCELLKQIRKPNRELFPTKQVAWIGEVPASVAVSVPHKTTLRKSEIHGVLEEIAGPHATEPSVLTYRDDRLEGKEFDPYVAGVEKYNETAMLLDPRIVEVVLDAMESSILSQLKTIPVPGGKPVRRTEFEVLNGIPGEVYYDAMDMSTSCGYPFMNSAFGKSKIGYLEGEPGEYMLARDKPVYPAFVDLGDKIRQGIVEEMVTCECAKDERLPLAKIYEKPKTRLFTILGFHYNMQVRSYFLDFSASLMRAMNTICCKVGINALGMDWTNLANQFLSKSDLGFSADYSSFDGRAPPFIFQRFCAIVDKYYGDLPGSENSKARHSLLMMASVRYTLCGDKLFRVVGGMPSGFSLTVLFNSLLNEFYMRYAFEVLRQEPKNLARAGGVTQTSFSEMFVAIYGDDNLVGVPFHLRWYSLPEVARVLQSINVIIKNGLDKNADVSATTFQPLAQLTFLSRGFVRHTSGYYLAPLKWVSIDEPTRWIRPGVGVSATCALFENIDGSLQEAFHHGGATFEAFKERIVAALVKRILPIPPMPSYRELENKWLINVTGDMSLKKLLQSEKEVLYPVNVLSDRDLLTSEQLEKNINEFLPGIHFCSSRTASIREEAKQYITVNCTGTQHKSWIRGPVTWKDLENKIWAYTMSAIEIEQAARIASKKNSDLLFVCPTGAGMSLVCCALTALATSQYTKHQIIKLTMQLCGTNKIGMLGAGAGQYLLLAAQTSAVRLQATMGGGSMYGSNLYDRSLKIGNCVIITGVKEQATCPATYWCHQASGFAGVRTSTQFIENVDPSATKLGTAIKKAEWACKYLYLFFDTFGEIQAQWVLQGLALSGSEGEMLDCADLISLCRQAHAGFSQMGCVATFEICKGEKKVRVQLKDMKVRVGSTADFQDHTPLLMGAEELADIDRCRKFLYQLPYGKYQCASLLHAGKVLMSFQPHDEFGVKIGQSLSTFCKEVFKTKSCDGYLDLFLTLEQWCNSWKRHDYDSEIETEEFVRVVNRFLAGAKYVSLSDSKAHFDFSGNWTTSLTENMSLFLYRCCSFNAEGRAVAFSFPKTHCLSRTVGVMLYMENKFRQKNGEKFMGYPIWLNERNHTSDVLEQVNFGFI